MEKLWKQNKAMLVEGIGFPLFSEASARINVFNGNSLSILERFLEKGLKP
jgi:hypothetical protein